MYILDNVLSLDTSIAISSSSRCDLVTCVQLGWSSSNFGYLRPKKFLFVFNHLCTKVIRFDICFPILWNQNLLADSYNMWVKQSTQPSCFGLADLLFSLLQVYLITVLSIPRHLRFGLQSQGTSKISHSPASTTSMSALFKPLHLLD